MNSALPEIQTPVASNRAVDPVTIAVVGINFGAKMARSLASDVPAVKLAAICDLDGPKARALAGELNVPAYTSLEEMLADPVIEAVAVFTGPVGRAQLIERILKAGKHVMTTKPFELDVAEAERACATARELGLVLHVNSPAPTPAGDMAAIRGWVADGALGRPISLQAMTWANYQEKADGSWLDDPVRCPAAPLFRLGVYFLGEFAGLLGKPLTMSVQQSRIRTGRPTADTAQMSISYENGALANIFASFCIGDGRPWADDVTISYEHGRIHRWMERTGNLDMSSDHAVVELHRPGKPKVRVETPPGDFTGWYNWTAFHAAVRNLPGSVRLDADGLVTSVKLLSTLTRASQSGLVEQVR